jgi:hypothetical protein
VLIYGYDYPACPRASAIDPFSTLAERNVVIGPVAVAGFDGLVHRVCGQGRVSVWEIHGVQAPL